MAGKSKLFFTGNSRWVHATELRCKKEFGASAEVPFDVDWFEAGLFKIHGPLTFLKVHERAIWFQWINQRQL